MIDRPNVVPSPLVSTVLDNQNKMLRMELTGRLLAWQCKQYSKVNVGRFCEGESVARVVGRADAGQERRVIPTSHPVYTSATDSRTMGKKYMWKKASPVEVGTYSAR